MFSVLPQKATEAFDKAANLRTEEAAAALLANPAWQRKTVVMVWEHKHIANAKLEGSFPGEKVTLRQLLALDMMKGVPTRGPTAPTIISGSSILTGARARRPASAW